MLTLQFGDENRLSLKVGQDRREKNFHQILIYQQKSWKRLLINDQEEKTADKIIVAYNI